MNLIREPIRRWFGFTRRERSAASILLLIIAVVSSVRYIIPHKNTEFEEIISGFYDSENSIAYHSLALPSNIELFSFDPNTVSFDTLILLGFSAKEANTLINYRNKGGRFINPSDIKKIYGLDENKANKLIPFINIPPGGSLKSLKNSGMQQKSLIDINNCDSADLVSLRGIGPVLSARIIKYRRLLGGYARIDQLREVYGLPEETYISIRGAFCIDTLELTRIYINSAGYNEIARLPYFDEYEVTAILKYRELNGRINSISDLTANKIISIDKANKVKPYLNFEQR